MSGDGMSPTWADIHGPRSRDSFDAKICECGHTYGEHPWEDNPRGRGGLCTGCPCRQRRDAELAARRRQQEAIAADPSHVHGTTHTAYACPGFVPFQVCDECGRTVPA